MLAICPGNLAAKLQNSISLALPLLRVISGFNHDSREQVADNFNNGWEGISYFNWTVRSACYETFNIL